MKLLSISLMICLLALSACGPKQVAEEVSKTVYATDVSVEVNDKMMTVAWVKSGEGAIAGYNVYISTQRTPKEPINDEPFPGDTDPTDGIEHYIAEGLENGVKYQVSVAVAYPDGTESKRSQPIVAVCGPRGEISLPIRYKSDQAGFSFEQNTYVPSDDVANDLYFFSREGVDILASPSRLDGFLNKNKFLVLPFTGDMQFVASQLMGTKYTATEDQVEVTKGDWVLIQKTNKKNALVQVTGFGGKGEARTVKLRYAYSTLVGELFF